MNTLGNGRQSPRERVIETNAKTNSQKITVLGDCLVKRNLEPSFSVVELRAIFTKAGEPSPRNLSRDIRDTIKLGYIAEDSSQSDHYYVTNSGQEMLEKGFGPAEYKPRKRKVRKSTSSPKTLTEFAWINSISVEDTLSEYPNYHSLKTRGDKALWILAYAASQDHDRVAGSEIEAIAEKLSDSIPNKQIAAAMNPWKSKNFISKTSEGYKILHNGMVFLKSKVTETGPQSDQS